VDYIDNWAYISVQKVVEENTMESGDFVECENDVDYDGDDEGLHLCAAKLEFNIEITDRKRSKGCEQ
jgi:hypothetical protein